MTTLVAGSNVDFKLTASELANADAHVEKTDFPGEVYVTYTTIAWYLMPP